MEHVNHPAHYQRKDGIECIDIIRHYTCDIANALKYLWRAGLKPEMGKDDAEKEIEDLKKALWYIDDYRIKIPQLPLSHFKSSDRMMKIVIEVTGHTVSEIGLCEYYDINVANAVGHLICIGIIRRGEVCVCDQWEKYMNITTDAIQHRILDINAQLIKKDCDDIKTMMAGYGVDGEDYVSKPGCVRETEPEHYDPLNMIVAFGRVYSLTDEVRKKPNGALYTPCENCDLSELCINNDGTEPLKNLCCLHAATNQQYYREVGVAKYSPRFGTIEVVDEMKEAELELKRLEEDN